ncbi:hypothetical protein [Flavobacterium sp. ZS1P14]|uniref:hypothetical protein n=1 Tax=Flavobacterium sp. ZS1P14 TaxID=3401729 RepID=UPI003AAD3AF1
MKRKLQKELKFKIGEQYGKYEFELDWVTTVLDKNLRYEVYQYIGKDKISIFDCEINKILLAYNCDFLAGVFYFIKGDCYLKFLAEIESLNTSSKIIYVVEINENISTLFFTKKKNKMIHLIDGIIKLGRI